MSEDITQPAAKIALDELAAGAKTPEDLAQLDDWEREIADERGEVLGGTAADKPKLVVMPDGTIATKNEFERMVGKGDDLSGPYNKGRRS